jgi:hypothetical protein
MADSEQSHCVLDNSEGNGKQRGSADCSPVIATNKEFSIDKQPPKRRQVGTKQQVQGFRDGSSEQRTAGCDKVEILLDQSWWILLNPSM